MTFQKVAELVLVLVILLFSSAIILGILIAISVLHELGIFNLDIKVQILVITGMSTVFLLIMKMIVDRIKEYNRYI